MVGILQMLIVVGNTLGTITAAHLYDNDFISIEGVTFEGKEFSVSMHIKEEKNND